MVLGDIVKLLLEPQWGLQATDSEPLTYIQESNMSWPGGEILHFPLVGTVIMTSKISCG